MRKHLQQDVEMIGKEQSYTSFREKLLGRSDVVGEDAFKEWLYVDNAREHEEDDDPFCATIRVTKEEKLRLWIPWKQSLIIKLLGHSISFKTLQAKQKEL